jgi:diguanylate cyclase
MVRAMIDLAQNLGMTPLAEGIETQGEVEFLVEHGCPLGQGSTWGARCRHPRSPRS